MKLNQNMTSREFKKILIHNGFTYVSTNGSHDKYKRGNNIVIINRKLNPVVAQRLIKENGLEVI